MTTLCPFHEPDKDFRHGYCRETNECLGDEYHPEKCEVYFRHWEVKLEERNGVKFERCDCCLEKTRVRDFVKYNHQLVCRRCMDLIEQKVIVENYERKEANR